MTGLSSLGGMIGCLAFFCVGQGDDQDLGGRLPGRRAAERRPVAGAPGREVDVAVRAGQEAARTRKRASGKRRVVLLVSASGTLQH